MPDRYNVLTNTDAQCWNPEKYGLSQKTELKLKTVKSVTSNEMEKENLIFSDKLKSYVCLYLCTQSLKGNILESVPTILVRAT